MKLIIASAAAFLLLILSYALFLNHVGVNHVGVAFNTLNGELYVQQESGWYVTSPLVRVVELSTLPMAVHVPSDAKVINTKIVKLKGDGVINFVRLQGFGYYLKQSQENIMMGYAFSGQDFSFLEVVQEGGLENAPTVK